MWINFHKRNMHYPHNILIIFSGVWYPFENKSQTPIIFQDPRPSSGASKRKTKVNTTTIDLLTKKYGLYISSWLTLCPPILVLE